ncbi:hypothetical protein [Streptomyces finlayi]|uniref:hypothetical protein n=1 Tax=Streptomyces finlayi TaxID=67296 RepID=UPI0035BC6FD4
MTSYAALGRRSLLTGALATAGLALAPRAYATGPAPFGRYGSPSRRLTARTLYVDPLGRGDHTTVQAAVDASGTSVTGTVLPASWSPGTAPSSPRPRPGHTRAPPTWATGSRTTELAGISGRRG